MIIVDIAGLIAVLSIWIRFEILFRKERVQNKKVM